MMIVLKLFLEFFKIGLFTFGGGYAMIPLIKEAVLSNNWLTELQFYDFIGVCESTPGPIAINMATYVGSSTAGLPGSLIATFAVVLPSFIIILLISTIFQKLSNNVLIKRALNGIKAVILGLILSTGILLTFKSLGITGAEFHFNYKALIITFLLGIIYFLYKIDRKRKMGTITLIIISAFLGVFISLINF